MEPVNASYKDPARITVMLEEARGAPPDSSTARFTWPLRWRTTFTRPISSNRAARRMVMWSMYEPSYE